MISENHRLLDTGLHSTLLFSHNLPRLNLQGFTEFEDFNYVTMQSKVSLNSNAQHSAGLCSFQRSTSRCKVSLHLDAGRGTRFFLNVDTTGRGARFR